MVSVSHWEHNKKITLTRQSMWRRTGQTSVSSSVLHRWGCRNQNHQNLHYIVQDDVQTRCRHGAWRPWQSTASFRLRKRWCLDLYMIFFLGIYVESKGNIFRRSAATFTTAFDILRPAFSKSRWGQEKSSSPRWFLRYFPCLAVNGCDLGWQQLGPPTCDRLHSRLLMIFPLLGNLPLDLRCC